MTTNFLRKKEGWIFFIGGLKLNGLNGSMHGMRFAGYLLMAGLISCQPSADVDHALPDAHVLRESRQRSSRIVVVAGDGWQPHVGISAGLEGLPYGLEGGSAAPITADGYFLTAAHVISGKPDEVIHLRYPASGPWRRARLVWMDRNSDIALLHVPIKSMGCFQWTTVTRRLPVGSSLFHLGAKIEQKQNTGRMLSELSPDSMFGDRRLFTSDVELAPGDSGGAVLDSSGRLLGINSAVKYRMPGRRFMDTEVTRPNLRKLSRVIEVDRSRPSGGG